jgi:hypothetical protein
MWANARGQAVAQHKLDRVLRHVLTVAGEGQGVPDAELLERFRMGGDAAAIELLIWRYQKLVFGVCQRILRDAHDAEDAFQATFLILARKAGSISKGDALGSWLFRVATRVWWSVPAICWKNALCRRGRRTASCASLKAV